MGFKYVFGLACVALTSSVSAQAPLPQPRTGQAQVQQTNRFPPALYQMNDVNKSLNLNQEQIANLNKVTEQMQTQYRDNYNKLGTLNEAERFARYQELNRQYMTDWNKGANSVFDANQRARYQQLNYQYGGFNSFYDPDVQKRLNLTADQMKDLREHADWSNQQLQEIYRTGGTNPTRGSEMYRDYWKAHQNRFNKYLTPEQQKTWSETTGQPYQFQPAFTPSR